MGDNRILKIILKDLQKLNEKKKSNGMRSVKKGADNNPKVTKMDFLPDKVLNKIAKSKNEEKGVECQSCGHVAKGDDTNCEMCKEPLNNLEEKRKKRRKAPKKDRKNPRQYSAPQGSSRDKGLDKAAALYAKGDVKGAARVRKAMEEPYMTESKQINELNELLNDMIEEQLLDEMLNDLENHLDEKRKRKKKKKKKKGGGLSAAVKKSLDKKADKRGLTRGSVYTEFRKGLAAYLSSGSRKGMSAHQWAHARVNSANPSKSWASVKKRKGGKKKKK